MERRTFLAGAILLPLLGAAGCQPQISELTVYLLDRSVPLRLINGFRQRHQSQTLKFEAQSSLVELYQRLQAFSISTEAMSPNWLTLGDYWLAGAIRQNLIAPLQAQDWQSWQELHPIWRQLVTRNGGGKIDGAGNIWGIPYRWGSLMMVYNPAHWQGLSWRPSRWQDLLRSHPSDPDKSPLTGKIALPNHPRIVTAIALKILGASANPADLEVISDLLPTLESLHQQVRFYSSNHYLEPLLLGDISLAVGWSTDILPVMQQYRRFEAVVPEEGTILSADVWVRPNQASDAEISQIAQDWVNYCLSPEVAAEFAIFSQGASPRFWQDSTLATDYPLVALSPEVQRLSEFLLPLKSGTQAQLQQLWQALQTAAA